MKRKAIVSVFAALTVITACTTAISATGVGSVPTVYNTSVNQDNSTSMIEAEMGLGEEVLLSDFFAESIDLSNFSIDIDKKDVLTISGDNASVVADRIGNANITMTDNTTGYITIVAVTVKQAPAALSFKSADMTLGLGEAYDFNKLLINDGGAYNVTYTSSNPAIVDANGGVMTAKKIGKAVITAKVYNGKKVYCTVTVKKSPTRVNLNKTSLTLGVGEEFDLNSSFTNGEGAYQISYSSADPSIATAAASGGLVTAKKVGTVVVTATTYNGKKVSCTVTVKKAPTRVNLNKTSLTLGIGETYDLNSSFPSGEGAYKIKYSSANPSIATAAASGGLVTAKKVGTVVVTATTYNGKKVSCTVTVKKAPTRVNLNKTSLTLGIGETYDLNSSFPSGEGAHYVAYTTSNSSTASVEKAGGLVKAKKVGTTTVTATAYNGKKVTCSITVKNAPTNIYLNSTRVVLKTGETYDLNSSFPKGQAAHYVAYTSAGSAIASVEKAGGLVKAKKIGTTTVTATAYNGKKISCKIVVASQKNVSAINGSVIKSKAAWSGKTLVSFKKGAKLNKLSSSGNWFKVEYNGTVGYVYNKTFSNKSNYSTVNKTTLPTVVDDWFFSNGTSMKTIFNYSYNMYYSRLPKESYEDMCVRAIKTRTGACYHHAAILKYMLDRAGYETYYVDGIDKYTGGGPHAWVMVKTSDGWRHIDSTQVTGLQVFYLVKDSVIQPYFSWDRAKYPAAK